MFRKVQTYVKYSGFFMEMDREELLVHCPLCIGRFFVGFEHHLALFKSRNHLFRHFIVQCTVPGSFPPKKPPKRSNAVINHTNHMAFRNLFPLNSIDLLASAVP